MSTEDKKLVFSIVMPTYNSEKTIHKALESIHMQEYDKSKLEILVIDGGSTDNTIALAKKFGATVLHNSNRLPEHAKNIGVQKANGRYLIEMDSDEMFVHQMQLAQREAALLANESVKALAADKALPPQHGGVSCAYLIRIGDPFTYFVYGSTGSVIKNNRRVTQRLDGNVHIYTFTAEDVKPIGDGGTTTVDLCFIREKFKDKVGSVDFAASMFNEVLSINPSMICIEEDDFIHESYATFKGYLKKLKFRVINNVLGLQGAGYINRAVNNKHLNNRKYLFMLYCISIICPLLDSIRLAIIHKHISFLLHFIYVYYVVFQIVIVKAKQILGINSNVSQYG